ncbi:MAG: pyridoxamine 5'-phosphate oxidase family protein [Pseudomonadota bacterium]
MQEQRIAPVLDQFETLGRVDKWCRDQLQRACADPRSPFRWPILCTAGPLPSGRVVVLRKFDSESGSLIFYTDQRTDKCRDLAHQDRAECVFFDPKKMIQLRAQGIARLISDAGLTEMHFQRVNDNAKKDYGSKKAPGTVLEEPPCVQSSEQGSARNFSVIELRIEAIDWLKLSREGHKRARLDWVGDGTSNSWIVP